MSSKRVMQTFVVLWPSTELPSSALMAIGQNRRPARAMRGPSAGQRHRNTMQHHDPVGAREGGEEEASDALKSQLRVAENVLATVPVDLDGELRFASGLLALTDRRLLARDPGGAWAEWPVAAPGLDLQLADHAGIGTLDLLDARGRLARWRYTLTQQPAALGCRSCSASRRPESRR